MAEFDGPLPAGRSKRRLLLAITVVVALAALVTFSWVDRYGPLGAERLRDSAPLEPGFASSFEVTSGRHVDLTTPFGSGTIIEVDGQIEMTRMLTVRNVANRTATLTDVQGFGGVYGGFDAGMVEYSDPDEPCRKVPRRVDVLVDRDAVHDDGSGASRSSATTFSGAVQVPAGRQAWLWVDSTYLSGPECSRGFEETWTSILVDYRLGSRADVVHVEHEQMKFVPDLDEWLEDSIRIERDGRPVMP